MGIKSVNAILRERAAQAFQSILLENLRGYRIACDAFNIIHTFFAVANKEVIMSMADPLEPIDRAAVVQRVNHMIINHICVLFEHGITVVWCWDGKSLPDKDECRAERKEARDKVLKRIAEARAELENTHKLARTAAQIYKLKSVMVQ